MFLLSGQRRLLDANPAWEQLTGIQLAEARGQLCRRARGDDPAELVLAALVPPPEALAGQCCQTRRRAPGKALAWWEIDFFPWSGADGSQAILGKIRVIAESNPAHAVLPEKLLEIRTRMQAARGKLEAAGDAPVTQRLAAQIRLAAQTTLPALILGPPGSGKAWSARTIHDLGARRDLYFARFDARLPAACLADLFSSSRHALLGTIYISDLECLTAESQTMLLQRLESNLSEPRLLTGSSQDLAEAARQAIVLPDLYHRLSALTIRVPALVERVQDLPVLLHELLPRAGKAVDRPVLGLTGPALELLRGHAWPGNIQELYDLLVQACRRCAAERIDVDDLPFYVRAVPEPPAGALPLDDILVKVERRLIELALRLSRGNKSSAAEMLAIWRPRLLRRLEQLGLEDASAQRTPSGSETEGEESNPQSSSHADDMREGASG